MSTSLLDIKNAAFSYGGTVIFKDVTLPVAGGGILCILGPNGCGKTTLVDAILGIHPLEKGSILLHGKDIRQMNPGQMAQQMAYVPQKHSRHFAFSVMDILLMGRTPYTSFFKTPGKEDRASALKILKTFGLEHLKDRDYTKLSGGEGRLVMIMRALVQDTPVIVMDEPTAHLDFKHELSVLETIVRLVRDQKRTLIMATHFPNHAFFLENEGLPIEVAFMHNQCVYRCGSPSSALTRENLEQYYGVKTHIASFNIENNKDLKQVIPVKTINKELK